MMRTTLIPILLAGLLAPPLAAQVRPATRPAVDVRVDPRVELICIIFRLAGNPEYNQAKLPGYARDVDEHFRPLAGHPVVQLAKQLRARRGVSFDAPMTLAVHLADTLAEAAPLEPLPAEVDPRWTPQEARQFAREAREFAKQANFNAFFKSHGTLYETATARMRRTLQDHARLQWFERFFGAGLKNRFHVVPGLLNGPSCYGVRCRAGDTWDMYCILGAWSANADGTPRFDSSVIPTVIHEFAHSYVNPIVDSRLAAFARSGPRLFARSEQAMRRQAYGRWQTVICESLVRATVVRYRNANDGPLAAMGEVLQQQSRGFVWMGELSKLLDEYESDRKTYPRFEDFMPRIEAFFDRYTSDAPVPAAP